MSTIKANEPNTEPAAIIVAAEGPVSTAAAIEPTACILVDGAGRALVDHVGNLIVSRAGSI